MKYSENMTFEEASKALIDELNANLATLHQNYHVEQSDWNKLYDSQCCFRGNSSSCFLS